MVVLILLLASVLRFISINQSLWLDEAIYVVAIRQQSLGDVLTKFLVGDFHPPLYISLLWIWDHLFGFSEIASRMPSLIFGVAAVYFTFILGREIFSRRTGFLAALLLGICPLFVYYSQETRMYSLTVLLSVLSFWFLEKFMTNKKWGVVGWTLLNILILYTDYPLALLIPTQFLFVFIFERKFVKKVFLSLIFSGIIFSPWLIIFQKQLTSGQAVAAALPNWATIVGGSSFKALVLIPVKTIFGRISFDNKYLYGSLVGIATLIYGYIVGNGLGKLDKKIWALIFWVTGPVIFAFLISFFIPVLSYFRVIFILPGFYLLVAKGLERLPKKIFIPALTGLCLISLASLVVYYTNPKFQREDWKNAVTIVEQKATRNGVIMFESDNVFSPFKYYGSGQPETLRGLIKVPAKSKMDVINLNSLVQYKKDIYLFEYLVDVNDPDRFLQREITRSGYKNIETVNFNGVGLVYHYQLK